MLASTYILERFVDLNEANAKKLDELRPGLWDRISSAIKRHRDAFDTEAELFKTLEPPPVTSNFARGSAL